MTKNIMDGVEPTCWQTAGKDLNQNLVAVVYCRHADGARDTAKVFAGHYPVVTTLPLFTADQAQQAHERATAGLRAELAKRVEAAFREGYWARDTYNDSEVSSADEKWQQASSWLIPPPPQQEPSHEA